MENVRRRAQRIKNRVLMIKVLGIPFDANSSFLKGPALAPPRIRLMEQEGSANAFSESGLAVVAGELYQDLGDLAFAGTDPQKAFSQIRQAVAAALADGSKLLCLGGDHSVSYPILNAYADRYQGLHVLHFDAHADLYENFDDNPYSHASPFARVLERGAIKSLTQVGIRTLNAHQRAQADKYGVRLVEMKSMCLDFLQELQGPLYISLDVDVLDPAFAPGVSHHEPGGLTTRELLHMLQGIGVPVVGADLVEYNPMRDLNNMTAMVGYKLMKELLAKMAER